MGLCGDTAPLLNNSYGAPSWAARQFCPTVRADVLFDSLTGHFVEAVRRCPALAPRSPRDTYPQGPSGCRTGRGGGKHEGGEEEEERGQGLIISAASPKKETIRRYRCPSHVSVLPGSLGGRAFRPRPSSVRNWRQNAPWEDTEGRTLVPSCPRQTPPQCLGCGSDASWMLVWVSWLTARGPLGKIRRLRGKNAGPFGTSKKVHNCPKTIQEAPKIPQMVNEGAPRAPSNC